MEKVFESERITFVKATMELIPDYLEMVNDIENVAKYISDRLEPYTLEEENKYMQDKLDSGATMYSMIEKSSGKFIGNTEFFDRKATMPNGASRSPDQCRTKVTVRKPSAA